ncbi:MAG: SPOR domain-containing protein [Candidatus Sericytochromatia bacterium]|nr:SPOR domain-containing protein [Candidatus Sericytochromatia bacterium]
MARGTELLASVGYWTILVLASAGAFTAGFHYTHEATANVPVKLPGGIGDAPSPRPPRAPMPSLTPAVSPSPQGLTLGAPSAEVATPAPPPGDDLDETQAEAGSSLPPQARAPVQSGDNGSSAVYRVHVGAFDTREGAQRQVEALQASGLNAVVVWDGGSYRAQLGAFAERERAFSVAHEVTARGFPVTVRH